MPPDITVLHVDDDRDFLELTATFLERRTDRFDLERATSTAEGLETLADRDVDCVVSDYDMPDVNGIEFLDEVRQVDADVPFILYTGKGSEGIASEAISAGVTDYLQKDAGTDQYTVLANRVENAVSAARSRRELVERTRRLETLISNLPGVVYRCANEPGWPMEVVRGEPVALSGYAAADLETDAVSWGGDVIHPDDRQATWDAVQDAVADGSSFELTYRIRTAGGETKWVWERGRPIADDEDAVLEGFITGITARKERELALRRDVDRLDAFADVVATDVSDAVSVAADELDRARDDPAVDANRHIPAVDASLDRLDSTLDDAVAAARDPDSSRDDVSLARVARRAWDVVDTPSAALEVRANRRVPAHVGRLRRLFENLFRNVVTRAAPAVTVTVDATPDGFSVAHDGADGVDPERVFDHGDATDPDAAGLGLTAVRQVADEHGWEVTIREREGGGATVAVTGVETFD